MKRYFAKIQYLGTAYAGWQSQPNATTIQDVIEAQLAKILRYKVAITGCGRTDAGVHATAFYFHFDLQDKIDSNLRYKLNKMLPKDLSITCFLEVGEGAHARFDATSRSYYYKVNRDKNPFTLGQSFHYPQLFSQSLEKLESVSHLLLKYDDFFPFCKTNTDVKTTKCVLTECKWAITKEELTFHITSNRFLRGMVRLIVGAHFNHVFGKLSLDEITNALVKRERLSRDLSVPAHGLFLSKVEYPSSIHKEGSPSYIY